MGPSLRENVLQAGERVSRLRKELAEAERELDALLAGTARKGGFPPKGTQVQGSVPAMIMERIAANPSQAYGADDLKDLAPPGANGLQYVRSSLYRLAKQKKLKKAGRGKFKLKTPSANNGLAVVANAEGAA